MNHLGLFSGIGGFEEAFRRAGANLIAACEIEPQAHKVLRRHFPGVRIINDVKAIEKDTFGGIPIELITGGFPCQDLSVAGRRAGLDGERSGLWFEYLRIIDLFRPRWVEIENVPGLLSGCGCFSCQAVGRLIRTHASIRRRKGGKTCAVCVAGKRMLESHSGRNLSIILRGLVELGYGVAWRVFDSQFDGVAQRRERVFIVASLRNGSCAEVLFEREGGAGDYPPSREAGQNVANAVTTGSGKSCGPRNGHGHPLNLITGTLNARQTAAGGLGTDFECDGGLIPTVVGTLSPGAHPGGFNGQDVGNLIAFGLVGHGQYADRPATLRSEGGDCGGGSEHLIAFGGNNTSGPIDVATACNAHGGTGRHDFESETFLVQPQISHALTSEGADASEDGTGRGTPIIAFTQNTRDEVRYINGDGQIVGALPAERGAKQQSYVMAVDFRNGELSEEAMTLQAAGMGEDRGMCINAIPHAIAFTERTRAEGRNLETQDELAYALTNPGSGGRTHSRQIAGSFGVRRLTPRECERLQGFPDDWTRYGDDGREISDSARYRMLGNAVCLPTVEWIARRMMSYAPLSPSKRAVIDAALEKVGEKYD